MFLSSQPPNAFPVMPDASNASVVASSSSSVLTDQTSSGLVSPPLPQKRRTHAAMSKDSATAPTAKEARRRVQHKNTEKRCRAKERDLIHELAKKTGMNVDEQKMLKKELVLRGAIDKIAAQRQEMQTLQQYKLNRPIRIRPPLASVSISSSSSSSATVVIQMPKVVRVEQGTRVVNFRAAFLNAMGPLTVTSTDGSILASNDAFAALVGQSRMQLLQNDVKLFSMIHPASLSLFYTARAQLLRDLRETQHTVVMRVAGDKYEQMVVQSWFVPHRGHVVSVFMPYDADMQDRMTHLPKA
jgi:PAS domain-containing protein